jgi:hypothetical protein
VIEFFMTFSSAQYMPMVKRRKPGAATGRIVSVNAAEGVRYRQIDFRAWTL